MKSRVNRRRYASTFAAVLLTLTFGPQALSPAVAELMEHEVVPVEQGFEPKAVDIISTLQLSGGQILEFIAEADGVGVVEVGPLDAPSALRQILAVQQATAYEVYRYLSDEPVPQAIIEDHFRAVESLGRTDSMPRAEDFKIEVEPLQMSSLDLEETTDCNYQESFTGNSKWASNWYALHWDMDQVAQDSYSYFEIKSNHDPIWSAGTSVERFLGACNGDRLAVANPSFDFFPEYWTGVKWDWSVHKQVDPLHQVTYHSTSIMGKKY